MAIERNLGKVKAVPNDILGKYWKTTGPPFSRCSTAPSSECDGVQRFNIRVYYTALPGKQRKPYSAMDQAIPSPLYCD